MAILPERALSSNGNRPNSTRGPSSPRLPSITRHADHDPPAFTASRNGLPALKVATVEAAISRLSSGPRIASRAGGAVPGAEGPEAQEADGFPSRERGGDTGEHGVDRSLDGRSGHSGFFGYMPDKVGLVHSSVAPLLLHFPPMGIRRPSVFPGLDDHAPPAPPNDIAAPADRKPAFLDHVPQGIGDDLRILVRLRRFDRLLEPFRKCIVGNGRADGLAQGIQLSELAFRKGGFVDHADIPIAGSR